MEKNIQGLVVAVLATIVFVIGIFVFLMGQKAEASSETALDHFKSCYLQSSGFDSCSGFDYNTDGSISSTDFGTFKNKYNNGDFNDPIPAPVFMGAGGVSLTTLDAIADSARLFATLNRSVYDSVNGVGYLLAQYQNGVLIGGLLFTGWTEEVQARADYISGLNDYQ
jgi:hypothetical protein